MSAFVDTNILVRHLTGDPPEMAARATAYLGAENALLLTDVVAAETVYVLESFYETPRDQVAEALRSLVAFESVMSVDPALLLRAAEVYETERVDFAEAYLVACAESTGVGGCRIVRSGIGSGVQHPADRTPTPLTVSRRSGTVRDDDQPRAKVTSGLTMKATASGLKVHFGRRSSGAGGSAARRSRC